MPKIELLDGAMGSEFIKRGINLPEHIWSADVNINYPDIVKEIHEEYIEAGAHYITTNTFRTTPRAFLINLNKKFIVTERPLPKLKT